MMNKFIYYTDKLLDYLQVLGASAIVVALSFIVISALFDSCSNERAQSDAELTTQMEWDND